MRRRWFWWALVALALTAVPVALSPGRLVYWRSAERIEAWLETQSPLGSTPHQVHAFLEREAPEGHISHTRLSVGSETQAVLGEYRLVFVTTVVATYGFDESGHLITIRVRKDVDAP